MRFWKNLGKSFLREKSHRDIEFYEEDLHRFLEFIFTKKQVDEPEIRARLGFSKEHFEDLETLCSFSHLIDSDIIEESNSKKIRIYTIKRAGINYLLTYKERKEEENHSKWIMWATIVMAISALIELIAILINDTSTRDFVFKKLLEASGLFIPVMWIIVIIYLAVKILGKIIYTRRKKEYSKSK